MIRLMNVPISRLLEVLLKLQKESNLCVIDVDEQGQGISIAAVRDPMAIIGRLDIGIPKEINKSLDINDLDKLIV